MPKHSAMKKVAVVLQFFGLHVAFDIICFHFSRLQVNKIATTGTDANMTKTSDKIKVLSKMGKSRMQLDLPMPLQTRYDLTPSMKSSSTLK